jgi:hypothetical protein
LGTFPSEYHSKRPPPAGPSSAARQQLATDPDNWDTKDVKDLNQARMETLAELTAKADSAKANLDDLLSEVPLNKPIVNALLKRLEGLNKLIDQIKSAT